MPGTDFSSLPDIQDCPWCGGKAAFVVHQIVTGKASPSTWSVMCDGDCPFRLRSEEKSIVEAARAWNDYVESWRRRLA